MAPVGYQEGGEKAWWWKVALHLDEAQLALANAMAHNLDDPRPVFALQDKLREAQATLLEIFRAKGLLPRAPNGKHDDASPMSGPAVPEEIVAEAAIVADPAADDVGQGPPAELREPLATEQTSEAGEQPPEPTTNPSDLSPEPISTEPGGGAVG